MVIFASCSSSRQEMAFSLEKPSTALAAPKLIAEQKIITASIAKSLLAASIRISPKFIITLIYFLF